MESRIQRLCVQHGLNTAGPGWLDPSLPSRADSARRMVPSGARALSAAP